MINKKIKIVILDDQALFLDLIKTALSKYPDVEIIAGLQSGNDLKKILLEYEIDLILLDVEIPSNLGDDGFEIAQYLKINHPDIKIISMSVNTQSYVLRRLIKTIKVDGFLDKNNTTIADLYAIINVVRDGHFYIDEKLEKKTLRILDIEKLTKKEKEITELIIKNHSNSEIAGKLNIAIKTVDNHRQNIFSKMKCNKVLELASQYYRLLYLQNENVNHLPNFKKTLI